MTAQRVADTMSGPAGATAPCDTTILPNDEMRN